MKTRNATLVAIAAVVMFAIAWNAGREVDYFTEPLQLLNGMLVRQGQQPHTGFYTLYPALNYYVLAGLFGVFGESALAWRVLEAILYVALVVATGWYFSRRGASSGQAALYTLVAAMIYPDGMQYSGFPGFALALCALIVYVNGFGVAAGVVTGLAAVSKLNFALYVVIAVVADLATADEPLPKRLRSFLAFIAPVIVCAIIYITPYHDHLGILVTQLWRDPQRILYPIRILDFGTGANRLGTVVRAVLLFTPLLWTAARSKRFAYPVLGVAAALLVTAAVIERNHAAMLPLIVAVMLGTIIVVQWLDRPFSRAELVVVVCLTMFLHYYLATADYPHFTFFACLIPLLLPFTATRSARIVSIAAAGLALILPLRTLVHTRPADLRAGLALLNPAHWNRHETDANRVLSGPMPLASPYGRLYDDTSEISALRYIASRTSSDDAIFVGVTHNDQVYLNDIRAYWISGRRVGTAYNMASLRLTTEDDVEQRMIADLERNQVRWVMLWDEPSIAHFFAVPSYTGSPRLDDFLHATFTPVATFGAYRVYARPPTINSDEPKGK